MRAFTLAASSLALTVVLQLACGSSDKPSNGGTGGAGEDTGGSAGSPASGGSSGKGGGTGGTVGTGGEAVKPDAAPAAPDAGSGSGGQGDAGQGGAGGASDAGAVAAETWDNFAKAFFVSYCVSCHDDDKKGIPTRDYHVMANVVKEKVEIGCGVAKSAADATKRGCTGFPPARQFPINPGPKPTDAERDRLLRWIDSGTP